MKHFLLAATATTAILAAAAASAATVTVTGITGTWINVVPSGVTVSNGDPISTLRWGTPQSGSGQSGYDFEEVNPLPVLATEFDLFQVAEFTHLNYPITGTFLTSAQLSIDITVDIGGTTTTLNNILTFTHDETTNTASNCPGDAVPCNDFVTVTGDSETTDTVTIGDTQYYLRIEGFRQTDTGPILTLFETQENQSNTAGLWMSFSTEPYSTDPVPLPAGAWLMLSGLGALAVARKRRKSA